MSTVPTELVSVRMSGGPQGAVGPQGVPGNSLQGGIASVAVANVASLSGLQNFDGVTSVDGTVSLLTGQATGSQDGPWVQHSGAWTRPAWFASASSQFGVVLAVLPGGTTYGSSLWQMTNATPITVDTNASTWQSLLADTGWITVTGYSNGYVNGSPVAQYRKIGNIVYMRGQASSGTGGAIFTLPVGFRPSTAAQQFFTILSAGAFGSVNISPAGVVTYGAGTTTDLRFDGINFAVN